MGKFRIFINVRFFVLLGITFWLAKVLLAWIYLRYEINKINSLTIRHYYALLFTKLISDKMEL